MTESMELQTLAPDFQVRINGTDLPYKTSADITRVAVYQDVEAPDMFTLEMINWDMETLEILWSDDDSFGPGKEVEILMGYMDDRDSLIKGEITGIEPEFCARETPMVVIRGYDRSHRLMRGCKTRTFLQMKDSDIASQVAGESQLSAETDDTGVTLDYVIQHNQTDMEFLKDRGFRLGYELGVEDKTLYFRKPKITESAALTLDMEKNLMSFFPRLSTIAQVDKETVLGWDPKQKAVLKGQAQSGAEYSTMGQDKSGPAMTDNAFGKASHIRNNWPVTDQAEADKIAVGRFNKSALTYIGGQGTCIGNSQVRAGKTVEIEGVGQRFGGLYYITSATHIYAPNKGYQTQFAIRRNAT